MSERWPFAKHIQGDAIDYVEAQNKHEWDRDYLAQRGDDRYLMEVTNALLKEESRFYQKIKMTPALRAAVHAFETYQEKEKVKFNNEYLADLDSKHFVKLKDSESVCGVFRGDPYEFKQHWLKEGSTTKSEICVGENCTYCQAGIRSTFRFRLNFIVKQENSFVPFIFEQGRKVYKQLHDLHSGEYNPLDKVIVRITRNGTGNDTIYSIIPVPNWKLQPDTEKSISSVKLHDLKNVGLATAKQKEEVAAFDDIPF